MESQHHGSWKVVLLTAYHRLAGAPCIFVIYVDWWIRKVGIHAVYNLGLPACRSAVFSWSIFPLTVDITRPVSQREMYGIISRLTSFAHQLSPLARNCALSRWNQGAILELPALGVRGRRQAIELDHFAIQFYQHIALAISIHSGNCVFNRAES